MELLVRYREAAGRDTEAPTALVDMSHSLYKGLLTPTATRLTPESDARGNIIGCDDVAEGVPIQKATKSPNAQRFTEIYDDPEAELMWQELSHDEAGNSCTVDGRRWVQAVDLLTKQAHAWPDWSTAAAHWHMKGVPYTLKNGALDAAESMVLPDVTSKSTDYGSTEPNLENKQVVVTRLEARMNGDPMLKILYPASASSNDHGKSFVWLGPRYTCVRKTAIRLAADSEGELPGEHVMPGDVIEVLDRRSAIVAARGAATLKSLSVDRLKCTRGWVDERVTEDGGSKTVPNFTRTPGAVTFAGTVTGQQKDGEHGGTVDVMCEFDRLHFRAVGKDPRRSCLTRLVTGGLAAKQLRPLMSHGAWKLFVGALTIGSSAALIYGMTNPVADATMLAVVEHMVGGLFMLEMVTAMLAFGIRGYWSTPAHKQDGIVALLTLAVLIYVDCERFYQGRNVVFESEIINQVDTVHIILCLRATRIFRALALAKRMAPGGVDELGLMVSITVQSILRLGPFMAYLIAVMYVFAIAGIELFGGPKGLTRAHPHGVDDAAGAFNMSNPVLDSANSYDNAASYAGASYDSVHRQWGTVHSYYYSDNFDNFPNAMVTLVHVILLNNWSEVHEACIELVKAQSLSVWIPTIYFFAFIWLVPVGTPAPLRGPAPWPGPASRTSPPRTAAVIVNLLVSFMIDLYEEMWGARTEPYAAARMAAKNSNLRSADPARTAALRAARADRRLTAARARRSVDDVNFNRIQYEADSLRPWETDEVAALKSLMALAENGPEAWQAAASKQYEDDRCAPSAVT